jgi:hypothetical protein
VKATLFDESHHRFGGAPIFSGRDLRELLDVDSVLQTPVRFGEHLEREEMTDGAYWNVVDPDGSRHELALDAGRRKQEIDDRSSARRNLAVASWFVLVSERAKLGHVVSKDTVLPVHLRDEARDFTALPLSPIRTTGAAREG